MSNPPDSNEDAILDKLLAELDQDATSEESNVSKNEKIKDKQAEETVKKLKYEKPDWADKKNDDNNTYDYQEKEVDDIDW